MHRLIQRHVRTGAVAAAVAAWLAGALWLGLATGAGAVQTATLMALGPLGAGMGRIRSIPRWRRCRRS